MLLLFYFRQCPFCAKVSQYMTINNIPYTPIESPKDSPSRTLLEKLGGKQQVPFLVDTSTGVSMYESDDIIEYLQKQNSQVNL